MDIVRPCEFQTGKDFQISFCVVFIKDVDTNPDPKIPTAQGPDALAIAMGW